YPAFLARRKICARAACKISVPQEGPAHLASRLRINTTEHVSMTGARRSGARRFGLALVTALIALVAGEIHAQAQGMGGMGGMGGGMGGMGAPGGGNPLAPASVGGTNGAGQGAPESSGAGRRSTVVLSPDAEKVIDVRVVGDRTVPLQKIAKNIMTRAD